MSLLSACGLVCRCLTAGPWPLVPGLGPQGTTWLLPAKTRPHFGPVLGLAGGCCTSSIHALQCPRLSACLLLPKWQPWHCAVQAAKMRPLFHPHCYELKKQGREQGSCCGVILGLSGREVAWPVCRESPVSVLRACCWPGHPGVDTETKHLQPSRGDGLQLLSHPSV